QYDEFIYSRARLINAAEKAKIHTVDWTPVALNNKTMTDAMIGNYGQEKTAPFSHIDEHELGGIWGHKTDMAGQPYAMEEDFVQS
ncbi:peroxidase family protein, partial [Klebsiella pneumoniae]|uniref:peroxidase family protein n=1 Tax=Klebsiella pneumoniae TaxID=573 RepID=UPI003CE879A1